MSKTREMGLWSWGKGGGEGVGEGWGGDGLVKNVEKMKILNFL